MFYYSQMLFYELFQSHIAQTTASNKSNNCSNIYNIFSPSPPNRLKVNRHRNRYLDIPCLDETRVRLSTPASDGSDYINANFVDGYNKQKGYILTQGNHNNVEAANAFLSKEQLYK